MSIFFICKYMYVKIKQLNVKKNNNEGFNVYECMMMIKFLYNNVILKLYY